MKKLFFLLSLLGAMTISSCSMYGYQQALQQSQYYQQGQYYYNYNPYNPYLNIIPARPVTVTWGLSEARPWYAPQQPRPQYYYRR